MASKMGFSTGKGFIEKVDIAALADNATKATGDENGVNIGGNYLRLNPVATPDASYKTLDASVGYTLTTSSADNMVIVYGSFQCADTYNVCFVLKKNADNARQLFYFNEVHGTANTPYGFVDLRMRINGIALFVDAYKITIGSVTETRASECSFKLLGCYEVINADK